MKVLRLYAGTPRDIVLLKRVSIDLADYFGVGLGLLPSVRPPEFLLVDILRHEGLENTEYSIELFVQQNVPILSDDCEVLPLSRFLEEANGTTTEPVPEGRGEGYLSTVPEDSPPEPENRSMDLFSSYMRSTGQGQAERAADPQRSDILDTYRRLAAQHYEELGRRGVTSYGSVNPFGSVVSSAGTRGPDSDGSS